MESPFSELTHLNCSSYDRICAAKVASASDKGQCAILYSETPSISFVVEFIVTNSASLSSQRLSISTLLFAVPGERLLKVF